MSSVRGWFPTVARILLGLVFLVFGLNGFLQFLPAPSHPGPGGAFLGALAATGYMFPLIKGTEVLAGLLLLGRRAVPLALVLLAPIVVNILAFHAFLDPAGTPMAIAIAGLGAYLAWVHRAAYVPLFRGGPAAVEPAARGAVTVVPRGI